MKKKFVFVASLLLAAMLAGICIPVNAEGEPPQVISSTIPVNEAVRTAVDALLLSNPPADTPYYAITYASPHYISLVALNLSAPNEVWNLENPEQIAWVGSLKLTMTAPDTYEAQYMVSSAPQRGAKLAALKHDAVKHDAGGGSYLVFPWWPGKNMMFGVRGVHNGGYGLNGYKAVDWVGGDDMGTNVAGSAVVASTAGKIDYICTDSKSVAVRLYSEDTDDTILYAHLRTNDNIEMEHTFERGQLIGYLVYGRFGLNAEGDPSPLFPCGWADQASNHYHLHWVFMPSGDTFKTAGCVLTISQNRWDCADGKTVKPNQWMTATGSSGYDDGSSTMGFWDYILVGVISIFQSTILDNLPAHTMTDTVYIVINMVRAVFRISWVLIRQNINIYPLLAVAAVMIPMYVGLGLVRLIILILRLLKLLPFL